MSSELVNINQSELTKFITQNKQVLNECEVRVGTFQNTGKFDANVDIKFFYNLKHKLDDGQQSPILPSYTKEIKDNQGNREFKTSLDDTFTNFTETKFNKKNNIINIDIKEYNLRLSVSKEEEKDNLKLQGNLYYRYKIRYSYSIPFGNFDLTIVYQGNNENVIKQLPIYEIEFELKKDTDLNNLTLSKIITFMLQIRQNNSFVMSEIEKMNVINEYQNLTKQRFFIGAQPQTLHKDDLSKLYQELYSVTDKADGARYFLFVNKNKLVYLIDNNLKNVIKTDIKSNKFTNCLIDGELINSENKSFYAFDILYFNNTDLRGNKKYLLKERLNELKNVVDSFTSSPIFSINIKKFIYRNVFLGSDIIMKNIQKNGYDNDGLIFTPINEPYPIKGGSWGALLKWKRPEQNTIDFYSIKKNSNEFGIGTWELYVVKHVKDPIILNRSTPTKVLFDTNKLCSETNTTVITYTTTFNDNLMDTLTGKSYITNTVIEYRWDIIESKFIPIRTRWDKTIGGESKHGNASHVACDIWKTINNPVLLIDIIKMTNASTLTSKQSTNSILNKSTVDDFFF